MREMGLTQDEQGFSSFFVKFFDDFSKFQSTLSTLHFEKLSKMAEIWQKMKKSPIQLAFNPLLSKPKSDF